MWRCVAAAATGGGAGRGGRQLVQHIPRSSEAHRCTAAPCSQQDITAGEKRGPTSYGNSNSVQVFSGLYTFAAKRADRLACLGLARPTMKAAASLNVGAKKNKTRKQTHVASG